MAARQAKEPRMALSVDEEGEEEEEEEEEKKLGRL
jgi:hypothetical protein